MVWFISSWCKWRFAYLETSLKVLWLFVGHINNFRSYSGLLIHPTFTTITCKSLQTNDEFSDLCISFSYTFQSLYTRVSFQIKMFDCSSIFQIIKTKFDDISSSRWFAVISMIWVELEVNMTSKYEPNSKTINSFFIEFDFLSSTRLAR